MLTPMPRCVPGDGSEGWIQLEPNGDDCGDCPDNCNCSLIPQVHDIRFEDLHAEGNKQIDPGQLQCLPEAPCTGVVFDDVRYFFFITDDMRLSPRSLVFKANDRCNQENLIEQLKNGVHAMRMPVDNLVSNWAYMVMASLAWSLKAWLALSLPEGGRWNEKYKTEKASVLRMEFRKFIDEFVRIPVQLVKTGRRLVFRLLAWNRYQHVFIRAVECFEMPLRC